MALAGLDGCRGRPLQRPQGWCVKACQAARRLPTVPGEGTVAGVSDAAPRPEPPTLPKLIQGALKLRLAGGAALVLVAGILLAPPQARKNPLPQEKAAPILQAEVQRREPARVFRGVQETGRKALRYTVAFHGRAQEPRVTVFSDFAPPLGQPEAPHGFGVLASGEGDVLTHVSAMGGLPLGEAELSDGTRVRAQVIAHEPETGLVLVRLEGVPAGTGAPLARSEPDSGELVVAAGRSHGRDMVAPVFVASSDGDRYTISAASGVVVPGTPLFNLEGEALAVTSGAPSFSDAYPIGLSLLRLRERIAQGRAFPSSIGIVLQPHAGPLASKLGAVGALVCDVRGGGPAARAGIRPGDLIVGVGELETSGAEEAAQAITSLGAGEPARLRLRRAGAERELEVTPEGTLSAAPLPVADAPPAGAPRARDVFEAAALAAAGVPAEARVLSVEGTPLRGLPLPRALLRKGPPWLVWLHWEARRFFAVVGAPAAP